MTDNSTISRWLGECRHTTVKGKFGTSVKTLRCADCDEHIEFADWKRQLPDYSTDPSAWTPALYQAIEDAGVWSKFMHHFCKAVTGFDWDECKRQDYYFSITSDLMRADTAQKATALARTIEEMEGQNE